MTPTPPTPSRHPTPKKNIHASQPPTSHPNPPHTAPHLIPRQHRAEGIKPVVQRPPRHFQGGLAVERQARALRPLLVLSNGRLQLRNLTGHGPPLGLPLAGRLPLLLWWLSVSLLREQPTWIGHRLKLSTDRQFPQINQKTTCCFCPSLATRSSSDWRASRSCSSLVRRARSSPSSSAFAAFSGCCCVSGADDEAATSYGCGGGW